MQGAATANQQTNCIPLVNLLGRHFQIRDDYINLTCTTVALPANLSMKPPKATARI
jgi:geranylgeranyl pyrophosphate synthase